MGQDVLDRHFTPGDARLRIKNRRTKKKHVKWDKGNANSVIENNQTCVMRFGE